MQEIVLIRAEAVERQYPAYEWRQVSRAVDWHGVLVGRDEDESGQHDEDEQSDREPAQESLVEQEL